MKVQRGQHSLQIVIDYNNQAHALQKLIIIVFCVEPTNS